MRKTLKSIGEFGLIERISKSIRTGGRVVRGIGDDTAVLNYTRDKYLLLTTDMLVEKVHFTLRDATPEQIGYKSLAVNISDIAAMGGIPTCAVIAVGLPKSLPVEFVDKLYSGLRSIAKEFNVDIVGGDTNSSSCLTICISLLGEVERNRLARRSGARIGDYILVTGNLGGSILLKHLNFIPRVREARFLVSNFKINSMIDISDGIASDIHHITESSNAGAVLYADRVPISPEAKTLSHALYDGEDFELLFTLSKKEALRLLSIQGKMNFAVTLIGEITGKTEGVKIISGNNSRRLSPRGFTHF
ncbi:MAG: thiamine-phosphate kinase [Candidatus Omnitrophica bacterium]|nr:thiamine-phosphate kinase [Candidatus Omnitrophota bacterium]